ncbi:glycosyl transferase, group 1 family protein [Chondrocystis sp. NIES-4102]|nr:glycosyl transferase, group 1 family protein [Chondrocystis sp. NIES-4102]
MRIAFIVDQFPTLSETFILNQITGLIDRGHEVDIYCDRVAYPKSNRHPPSETIGISQNKNNLPIHSEVQQYELLSRTYYTPIPANLIWRVLKAFWLLISNFYKNPQILGRTINLIKYNRSNYGEPASFLRPIYLTIPWLKQPPYDVIVCHYGRNGLKAILLKDLGLTQAKITVFFHGYDLGSYLNLYSQNIYKNLFIEADLLQPISQHWQKKIISLGCPKNKIIVHHMGVDCQKFPYLIPQEKDNEIRLISIARLVSKKGLKYSIQAVAQLIPRYPNLEYQIIGDGILKSELQQLIQQLNVVKNIKLLGWKQQPEIATLLAQADIILAPSVTSETGDCEGIPVSLMEAMARGLPVISTYHSGIPELIQDGISGYLLPEKDIDNLAIKIEQLLINPQLRQKMGQAGRKKIETEYNIQLLNDRLVAILQQMLEGVGRGTR